MKGHTLRYLIGSQVLNTATLFACFCIKPGVLLDNKAISLYGTYAGTAIPYVFGLLGSAYLIIQSSRTLTKKNISTNQTLSKCLVILAGLLVGLTVTPYTLNSTLFYLHAAFAFLFFLFELGMGLWLLIKVRGDAIDIVLFIGQAIGFTISILSLGGIKILHLLVVGQLITIWMFALLLTRTVYLIEDKEGK